MGGRGWGDGVWNKLRQGPRTGLPGLGTGSGGGGGEGFLARTLRKFVLKNELKVVEKEKFHR